jgi:hypothetical protein
MTGQTLKQEALALVDSHTPEEWKTSFVYWGCVISQRRREFTAEEIVDCCGKPPTPNAIGAAMHSLARELGLVRVGYRPAKRPSRHAGVVAVWRLP